MLLLLAVLLTTSYAAKTLVVPLISAEQSSNYYTDKQFASSAIDGDFDTGASTGVGADAWQRVYFSTDLEVGKVVIERGWQTSSTCVYQMFIYQGDTKYSCGDTFTYPYGRFYNGYENTTIDCRGRRGGSIVLEQTVCEQYIGVSEYTVYLTKSGPMGPCYLKETDLYGGDISCTDTFTSVVNCKNTCAATSGCVAFTTVQDASQRCCLKNSNYGAPSTLDYCTSGYMNCFNEMWTAELAGYSNLAYNRPAYQSSIYQPYVAALAVDGNTDGSIYSGLVTHTSGESETNPWWMVSLAEKSYVAYIRIYNRVDCCGDRLNGATIYLDDLKIGVVAYVSGQQPYTFMVGNYGTMVKVIVPGGNKVVSLAELEIYGRTRSPVDELYCIKESTTLSGGNIGLYSGVTTTLGCLQLCMGWSECKAITVDTTAGCSLKSSDHDDEATGVTGSTSVRMSCLAGGSCWQKGYDLADGLIKETTFTSVSSCISACRAETGCVAITTDAESNKCNLKNSAHESETASEKLIAVRISCSTVSFGHWMAITTSMVVELYEEDYPVYYTITNYQKSVR